MELAWELIRRHPRAAARTLEELPAADVAEFIRETPTQLGSAVLSQMVLPAAARVVEPLEPEMIAALVAASPSNTGAGIMRYLDGSLRGRIVECLPAKKARACRSLLRYAEDAVGAWMEPLVPIAPDDVTVESAARRLRQSKGGKTSRLYVVDPGHRLRGVVEMWDLASANREVKIASLVCPQRRTLAPQTKLLSIVDHTQWIDADELPVVGMEGNFLGVLRHVDLIRLVEEQFPQAGRMDYGDAAIEFASDIWQGMSRYLETVAAVPEETAEQSKGK